MKLFSTHNLQTWDNVEQPTIAEGNRRFSKGRESRVDFSSFSQNYFDPFLSRDNDAHLASRNSRVSCHSFTQSALPLSECQANPTHDISSVAKIVCELYAGSPFISQPDNYVKEKNASFSNQTEHSLNLAAMLKQLRGESSSQDNSEKTCNFSRKGFSQGVSFDEQTGLSHWMKYIPCDMKEIIVTMLTADTDRIHDVADILDYTTRKAIFPCSFNLLHECLSEVHCTQDWKDKAAIIRSRMARLVQELPQDVFLLLCPLFSVFFTREDTR